MVDETEDVEPIGRIKVASENLCGTVVESVEVPLLIDEIPLLAVLAAAAEGTTTICGVSELKVKESDRLSGIAELVRLLGRECAIKGEGKNLTLRSTAAQASLKEEPTIRSSTTAWRWLHALPDSTAPKESRF